MSARQYAGDGYQYKAQGVGDSCMHSQHRKYTEIGGQLEAAADLLPWQEATEHETGGILSSGINGSLSHETQDGKCVMLL